MTDHVGDDPTPHAGSGAPRRNAAQLAADPAFTGTYAKPVGRGTYASRPASDVQPGYEWIQTDSAGGNQVGVRTRYNGTTWDVVSTGDQIARVGSQSNNWFTTMPDPFPPTAGITFQAFPGAGYLALQLLRLTRDIPVASLALRLATGGAPYTQSIYRVDGTTLTQVVTTGALTNPNVDNTFRRDPVTQVATLTAGTTYYYAITAGAGTFQFYSRGPGSSLGPPIIGGVLGDAPGLVVTAAQAPGSTWHPAPASIDTTSLTYTNFLSAPLHYGLSIT